MLLYKMEGQLGQYSKTDRKIADVILLDPKAAVEYTMEQLAQRAGVSQGSIHNFSTKLCGGGFAKLKILLAQEMGEYRQADTDLVGAQDSMEDVLHKVIGELESAYRQTAALNDPETMVRVANMILMAKRIEIYGIYTSGIVAEEFYHRLLVLGLPAVYVTDGLMCPVSATMLDEDCLAIAVSTSGQTKDICDALEMAKENGVPRVCITANPKGPVAALCEEVLQVPANPSVTKNRPDVARPGAILLAETLCTYIRQQEAGERKQYDRLSRVLSSHSVKE